MLLADVQVILLQEPADDDDERNDVWASINWNDQKDIGLLQVCRGWGKLPPTVKTECIVHELVHLLQRDVDIALDVIWSNPDISVRDAARIQQRYHQAGERATHKLAMLILPSIPAWPGDNEDARVHHDQVFVQRTDDREG